MTTPIDRRRVPPDIAEVLVTADRARTPAHVLASQLGLHPATIARYRQVLVRDGRIPPRFRTWTADDAQRIVELFQAGKNIEQVARELRTSVASLEKVMPRFA